MLTVLPTRDLMTLSKEESWGQTREGKQSKPFCPHSVTRLPQWTQSGKNTYTRSLVSGAKLGQQYLNVHVGCHFLGPREPRVQLCSVSAALRREGKRNVCTGQTAGRNPVGRRSWYYSDLSCLCQMWSILCRVQPAVLASDACLSSRQLRWVVLGEETYFPSEQAVVVMKLKNSFDLPNNPIVTSKPQESWLKKKKQHPPPPKKKK